ncbi:putative UDP-glycosyltransferase 72B2 [Hypsibius exemplaris]|uniref:UDP-glycosyltransferase 72B2 n=1 Tax=Hypsibius exemplaris TaxID=2072580 RepID=A0A1W0X7D0_HYPEX|nr:putative UDP-glycosyltransferase 72B2 [Hypsibius exemplaris]
MPVVNSSAKLHILLACFPAFGHTIPLLELAKKLSRHNRVTFAVSAANIAKLRALGVVDDDAIELVGIEDGVEEEFDNPADLGTLDRILAGVLPATETFLSALPARHESTAERSALGQTGVTYPVDVVIVDMFLGKPVAVCHARGIPFYIFNPSNAMFLQHTFPLTVDSPTVPLEQAEIFILLPPSGQPMRTPFSHHAKSLFLPIRSNYHLAKGILINTVQCLEEDGLREIPKEPSMAGVSVFCVGPLISVNKTTKSNVEVEGRVKDWLDRQTDGSVVFLSFGTIATPKPEEIKRIGQALLVLGQPFIWSLRTQHHQFLPEELVTKTQSGSVEDDRHLITPWTPQKLVLAYSAVAVFVSHCGWNSTLEAVASGKATVAWPMFADQLHNALLTVQWGTGVLIPETGVHCPRVVPVEEIVAAIAEVGGWKDEKGTVQQQQSSMLSRYQVAAKAWAAQIAAAWKPGGTSSTEFDRFLEELH